MAINKFGVANVSKAIPLFYAPPEINLSREALLLHAKILIKTCDVVATATGRQSQFLPLTE